MVTQAKNKYNAPKYRLVVRFTNKEIVCQIAYARIQGDFILAAARSKELPRYGINHGLTNWTAGTSCFCILLASPLIPSNQPTRLASSALAAP